MRGGSAPRDRKQPCEGGLVEASVKSNAKAAGEMNFDTGRVRRANELVFLSASDNLDEGDMLGSSGSRFLSVLSRTVGEHMHGDAGAFRELLEGQVLGLAFLEESSDFGRVMAGGLHGDHPAEIAAAVQVGVTRRLPHVALGRGESLTDPSAKSGPATKRMHRKRQTKRSQKAYKRRKVIAEPPFGWIKSVMGFREFSMRGLSKVSGEWSLVCMALNIRRMATRIEWT